MMKTRKLLCMILVAATISCFSSIPSFAFSTPSEATPASAMSSNAFPMDDYSEFDDFDTLNTPNFFNAGEEYTSSVDLTRCYVRMSYYDMQGRVKYENIYLSEKGYFVTPVLSDFASLSWLDLCVPTLPRAGKYLMDVHFSSNAYMKYDKIRAQYLYSSKNTVGAWSDNGDYSFTQFSGDFHISSSLAVNSDVSEIRLVIGMPEFQLPYGGYFSVSFSKLPSNSDVSITPPTDYTSSSDQQSNIADNTSAMADTLKEIVQTISNQLAALWDQMFNLMHVPQLANDDKNTGLITGAIEEQTDADRQNTEDIIAAEESNTTTIVNNNNENTEKLTNGYDNSALNSENDKLNNSLTEYDNAEKQVMDKVNHALDDINFNQSLDNYMQPILLCSTFMQRLYDNSGGFKDVINLTLIVSIASIVVGIYRFKGGD